MELGQGRSNRSIDLSKIAWALLAPSERKGAFRLANSLLGLTYAN